LGGEGVCDDRARVCEQHGATDALQGAHDDQPHGAGTALHPGDRQHDAEEREDGEAEVEGAGSTVDVTEASERHDEHGCDDEEPEDQPQQVVGVAGLEGIDVDPLEDRGQGDQQDAGVDRGDQDAERRVGQGDPLVVIGDGIAVVVQADRRALDAADSVVMCAVGAHGFLSGSLRRSCCRRQTGSYFTFT
jgi:hypothetical protein